ncbi:hypothetical protein [Streptomyces sp. NBC_00057]|uniref:hypothetical protein n=1 Tax=Streptomyces sp. NBC_00057 TaxID=2975634 RepID=UPI003244D1D9
MVNLPMRRSELNALAHLLEFAEGGSHLPVRLIAARLGNDITQRSSNPAGLPQQQQARSYAYEAAARREEARRRLEHGKE